MTLSTLTAIALGCIIGTALFIYGAWWLCRVWSKASHR